MDAKGEHSHTRGTMNITGNWRKRGGYNESVGAIANYDNVTGCFKRGPLVEGSAKITGLSGGNYSGTYDLGFDASQSGAWTGSTSSEPNHTHTISGSTSSVGSNQPINIMPPHKVAYCWKRTA